MATKRPSHGNRDLDLLLNSIPGMVVTCDAQGNLEYVNKQVLDYLGMGLDELKEYGWTKAVHPEDADRVSDARNKALQAGRSLVLTYRLQRRDGVYRWFKTRNQPLLDDHGRVLRWYALTFDIDDRKKTEDATRESERQLQLFLETIPAFIWRGTPEGRLDYGNQRLIDYTGETLEFLSSEGWRDLIHPLDLQTAVQTWLDSAQTGKSYRDTYRFRRADGEFRWVQSVGEPFYNADGQIIHWYGLLLDIDDVRKAEDALRESERDLRHTQAQLARASQIAAVAELSASIAHEISQPLAALFASARACHSWLSNSPPNIERALINAERMIRDAKGAADVIKGMRSLFKQADSRTGPIQINDLVTEVCRLVTDQLAEARIDLDMQLDPALPPTMANRIQIQQVIMNLIQNSIEAADPALGRASPLQIRTRADSSNILVEVSDQGVGIRNAEKVFDAFFTTKANGMGMGLAICRSIVEAHEGRLWVEENQPKGARFLFTLPVKLDDVG
jgi:PAS domain S-box-containing protein